jgi:hypothetical protein
MDSTTLEVLLPKEHGTVGVQVIRISTLLTSTLPATDAGMLMLTSIPAS